MDYLLLGLLVFGGWWTMIGVAYWYIIKKVLLKEELTAKQRVEFFKTRRQRILKK